MHKILFFALIAIILTLIYQLYLGHGGKGDDDLIHKSLVTQNKVNTSLIVRNNNMIMKINSLKGSRIAIEERARYELNLINPNEVLLILPQESATK